MREDLDLMIPLFNIKENTKSKNPDQRIKKEQYEKLQKGVLLINSLNSKSILVKLEDPLLFSENEIYYRKKNSLDPQSSQQDLEFYKNFQKNLKIQFLKNKLKSEKTKNSGEKLKLKNEQERKP